MNKLPGERVLDFFPYQIRVLIIPELINCHSRHSTEYIIVRKSKNINNSIKRFLGWIGQVYTATDICLLLRLNRTSIHFTYLYIKLSTYTEMCLGWIGQYLYIPVHKAVYRYRQILLNRTSKQLTYLYKKLSTYTDIIGQVYTVHACTMYIKLSTDNTCV